MVLPHGDSQLQLRSLVRASGLLELSLQEIPITPPGPDELLVRIEAAPLNPSDLALLSGGADITTAVASATVERPVTTARIPPAALVGLAGRLDQSMAVGNEGAGVVVDTGHAASARALLGKKVAVLGGAMYTPYRTVAARDYLLLPDDATPAEGASAFINPLTALGMVETMRREGHHALVHTAAASNLGQMLQRICTQDGVALVNIVRSEDQAGLLRALGARHVCDSQSPRFIADLNAAVLATGATIAFDAVGGGPLASQILGAMELPASAGAKLYSRYGSTLHKQVYLYGTLDLRPTELIRNYGMAWGVGGWLVTPFLRRIGPEAAAALKRRVVAELKSTSASRWSQEISLTEALLPEVMALYGRRATGQKFLINPSKFD